MARKRLGRAIEQLIKTQKNGTKKIESYSLYKDLVVNALDDGVITVNERSVLERVGKNLGLSPEEQDVIIVGAEKDYATKQKRAETRKKASVKKKELSLKDFNDLEKKNKELIKLNKALDKENKKLTESIKKIGTEHKKLKNEHKQLVEAALEPIMELEPIAATEEDPHIRVGTLKKVICPHCDKENSVVMLEDEPTILTCEHCNERSYTE